MNANEPQSPPAAPVIPIGIATKVGYGLGLVASLATALLLALEGLPEDASEATIFVTLIAAAAGAVIQVNNGRMGQAKAAIAQQPNMLYAERDLASGTQGGMPLVTGAEPDDEELEPSGLYGGEDLEVPEVVDLDDPDNQADLHDARGA